MIKYEKVIQRANELYKNAIEAKYREKHPDLDISKVVIQMDEATESVLQALIEAMNNNEYSEPRM